MRTESRQRTAGSGPERRDPPVPRAALSVLLTALALGGTPLAAVGQDANGDPGPGTPPGAPSLLLVDRDTEVRRVGFRFAGRSELEVDRLREAVALDGAPALFGLRSSLDFLPAVSTPELELFDPLVLQRDVARLRRLFRTEGYRDVAVDYEVALDTASNEVAVTFLVEPGSPLRLDTVRVSGSVPDSLASRWPQRLDALNDHIGERYGVELRATLLVETTDWLRDRGHPWARVEVEHVDTLGQGVGVVLAVDAGVRARVDRITVEGQDRLSDEVVDREIAIDPGDPYDASAVTRAQRELYELDLVRRALGGVEEDQPHDSTVSLRFRIDESRPRLLTGRVGWMSASGVVGEAHWSHRNFLGGARTLTTSALVESGWGGLDATEARSIGLSAHVRQPYVGNRSGSASVGPFVRYRDDLADRSLLYGVETSFTYRTGVLASVTLQHELSRLRVDDALQLLPIADVVERGDSAFAPFYLQSVFTLSATWGTFDDRLAPRSGFVLEPALQLTGPGGISDVQFFRAAVEASLAVPLGSRFGLFLRATGGRLLPWGESDPATSGSTARSTIGLRSFMFTAGGTSDVRGWGRGMLGPKIPDVASDPETGAVSANRYLPVGGLARLSGSVELLMPLPLLGRAHRTYAFLDAGRVWSPEPGFEPGDSELAVDPWGYAAGGGLEMSTPIGPVRLGVGYKLNPTRVDLLPPGPVARALAVGDDLSGLAADDARRWHLHLSIGRGI